MSTGTDKQVQAWNASYPVGTPVVYWPGVRQGEGRESTTRTPAWALPSGHILVSVHGYPGGIALTHVEVYRPTPGQDFDIDGNVWPGSKLDRHLSAIHAAGTPDLPTTERQS